MQFDPMEIFTRIPCEITIEDGIATFHLNSGGVDFRLVMPVSVLLQNVEACRDAIIAWQRRIGAEPIPLFAGCRDCSRHPHATRA